MSSSISSSPSASSSLVLAIISCSSAPWSRLPVSPPFEEISTLDRLVHEPARLAILTALAACRRCDFLYMQAITHLSKGNLSNHLQKLEEGGLVEIEKGYKGRVPCTTLRITVKGRA